MRHPTSGTAIRALSLALSLTMASAGCVDTTDPTPTPTPTPTSDQAVAPSATARIAFDSGGYHVVVATTRADGDDMYRGTMTVTDGSGVVHAQSIEYPAAPGIGELPRPVHDADGDWLEIDGTRVRITDTRVTADGVELRLLGADGIEFTYSHSGGNLYALPAVAVVAIVGIAICGAIVLANISLCAWRDRCWEFSLIGGIKAICSGKCIPCDPPPQPVSTEVPAEVPTDTTDAPAPEQPAPPAPPPEQPLPEQPLPDAP